MVDLTACPAWVEQGARAVEAAFSCLGSRMGSDAIGLGDRAIVMSVDARSERPRDPPGEGDRSI